MTSSYASDVALNDPARALGRTPGDVAVGTLVGLGLGFLALIFGTPTLLLIGLTVWLATRPMWRRYLAGLLVGFGLTVAYVLVVVLINR
jgi:hypothetical protein